LDIIPGFSYMYTFCIQTPSSVDVLGNSEGAAASYNVLNTTNSKTADMVINGALVQAKLFIYGKV
jgi:vacuolar protein sorting-associated protein 13A/C